MFAFNCVRISTAVCSQLLGLGFLMMSLSLFVSHSDAATVHDQNTYLLNFGLWLLYGFLAMSVSWAATLSLARSVYRSQVQKLCCSGMTISAALLSLSCANEGFVL